MVEAIHTSVDGRARFKISGLYRCEPLKRFLESKFSRSNGNGITSFSANTLTGNALICFNSATEPESIGLLIEALVQEYQHSVLSQQTDLEPKWASYTGEPSPVIDAPGSARRQKPGITLDLAYQDQPTESWHVLDSETCLASWSTVLASGLNREAVQEKFQKFGPNAFPETEPRSRWEMFLEQFQSLPVALLSGAAGLSIVTGGILDAVLIMGVVVANAVLAYASIN